MVLGGILPGFTFLGLLFVALGFKQRGSFCSCWAMHLDHNARVVLCLFFLSSVLGPTMDTMNQFKTRPISSSSRIPKASVEPESMDNHFDSSSLFNLFDPRPSSIALSSHRIDTQPCNTIAQLQSWLISIIPISHANTPQQRLLGPSL